MTESQKIELRELRDESIRNKEVIHRIESAIDDTEYEIACLNKWKKGRWLGFFASFTVLVIATIVFLFYERTQTEALLDRFETKLSAISFSVSTTAIMCLVLFIGFFTVLTIILGLKLVMELGSSSGAKKLAKHFSHKNYYIKIEPLLIKKNDQTTSLIELKARRGQIEKRIAELEKEETPWYEQKGQATLKYY